MIIYNNQLHDFSFIRTCLLEHKPGFQTKKEKMALLFRTIEKWEQSEHLQKFAGSYYKKECN